MVSLLLVFMCVAPSPLLANLIECLTTCSWVIFPLTNIDTTDNAAYTALHTYRVWIDYSTEAFRKQLKDFTCQ